MVWDPGSLAEFVRLLEVAEEIYPYVTHERLRRLTRTRPEWVSLSGTTAALIRQAETSGLLFSEDRLRLTRADALRPIRVYRLNRRHKLVLERQLAPDLGEGRV